MRRGASGAVGGFSPAPDSWGRNWEDLALHCVRNRRIAVGGYVHVTEQEHQELRNHLHRAGRKRKKWGTTSVVEQASVNGVQVPERKGC